MDAVNEIPHTGPEDYRERIGLWRELLADLAREAPGVRAVFTCRSLDYSALLSTPESPVPQVRIEPLEDARVEQFLGGYDPVRGPRLWRELQGTPQLDLFRSPFYLRLLLASIRAMTAGSLSKGRAALFTGFVRQALWHEVEAGHPLFQAGALLDWRDHRRVPRGECRDGFELPAREPSLCAALSRLAFRLQERRGAGDGSRVRAGWDDALALLGGGEEAERLLKGGEALHVIEEQWDDVLFVHQLFQEYFAARALVARPEPELARSPWRATEMVPSLADTLAALADSDPLPAAPATGWDETFALAAAMAPDPAGFVAALEAPMPIRLTHPAATGSSTRHGQSHAPLPGDADRVPADVPR
ncbi:MAG: NACHT domain-containing protein [Actinomycetota bacterium]